MNHPNDRDAKNEIRRSDEQLNSRRDPEKEMPDPEQVEQDRERAKQEYGDQEKKAS